MASVPFDAAVLADRAFVHQHPRASCLPCRSTRERRLPCTDNRIDQKNVYAFCNLHDVSWGTKGSDKVEALPAAQSKKDGGEKVVETQEKVQEGTCSHVCHERQRERERGLADTMLCLFLRLTDIDYSFKATVLRAVEPFEEEEEIEKPSMDDRNKTFRTRFICVWLFMNGALALAVTKLGDSARSR